MERISSLSVLVLGAVFGFTSGNDLSTTRNVLGQPLALCSTSPLTGWYRDGYCRTDAQDHGTHTVCAQMTDDFLQFTKSKGNDLITPHPQYQFPGLRAGDKWCLCAIRWNQAKSAGKAPPVDLAATNDVTTSHGFGISVADLQEHDVNRV